MTNNTEQRYQRTNRIIGRQYHSCIPLCVTYDKRNEAYTRGQWDLSVYYHFLYRLIAKIQRRLDCNSENWETPDWRAATQLIERSDNLIDGLSEILRLDRTHNVQDVRDLETLIYIFSSIPKPTQ